MTKHEQEGQMRLELNTAFDQLDFEFKYIALLSIKGQAARCVARKPTLRLVRPEPTDLSSVAVDVVSKSA